LVDSVESMMMHGLANPKPTRVDEHEKKPKSGYVEASDNC